MGFSGISPWSLVLILLIVLVIFGGKRLRNVGGDLGAAIKGFKRSMKDETKGGGQDTAQPAKLEDKEDNTVEGEVVSKADNKT